MCSSAPSEHRRGQATVREVPGLGVSAQAKSRRPLAQRRLHEDRQGFRVLALLLIAAARPAAYEDAQAGSGQPPPSRRWARRPSRKHEKRAGRSAADENVKAAITRSDGKPIREDTLVWKDVEKRTMPRRSRRPALVAAGPRPDLTEIGYTLNVAGLLDSPAGSTAERQHARHRPWCSTASAHQPGDDRLELQSTRSAGGST